MILPVVLYGCPAWSLTLRVEHRVLRKIFGSKRDRAPEEMGRLHNEEICNLHCLQNIILVIISRIMRMAGHVARMGGEEDVYVRLSLKVTFKGWDGTWTGLIWLSIGTGGGL